MLDFLEKPEKLSETNKAEKARPWLLPASSFACIFILRSTLGIELAVLL